MTGRKCISIIFLKIVNIALSSCLSGALSYQWSLNGRFGFVELVHSLTSIIKYGLILYLDASDNRFCDDRTMHLVNMFLSAFSKRTTLNQVLNELAIPA